MPEYQLHVFRKKNSDPLTERYASEEEAKAACSALARAIASPPVTGARLIVLTNGGGIAISASDFESAVVKPAPSRPMVLERNTA
jgi:hypothetical protein